MLEQQKIRYFLFDDPEPVHGKNLLWNKTLPSSPHQHSCPCPTATEESLTYGQYFEAVSDFLIAHQSDFMPAAAFHIAKQKIGAHEISGIDIHLEKHGAFYHPARVVLQLARYKIPLVVNVAVSAAGKKYIRNEYRQLKRLRDRFKLAWTPRVFGYGRVKIDGRRHVRMFLGEWFEGFSEFHVSGRNHRGSTAIRVWDPNNEHLFLSLPQAQGLFEQAAMILTAYYDIETFEQILSWHHAAGDFVVNMQEDEPRVRLISVRRYEPLFHLSTEVHTLETILNTLLIFLLNMSIRLRIDRRDGVGDMVWIEADVVEGILLGFFKGLVLQSETSRIPHALIDAFKTFLLHLPEMDIRDIFEEIIHHMDPKNSELAVIKSNLDRHVAAVLSGIRQLKTNV